VHAENLGKLDRIEVYRRSDTHGGLRRFGLSEGFMDGRRKRDRSSATTNVKVHDVRRFVDKMIVERRLLDTSALQGVDHRSDFRLQQDQVTH